MATPPDLVTQPYVLAYLADLGLTPAQLAKLPALTASASAAVRSYCKRVFTVWAFDELYTVEPPDREITLRQFPLVSVDRCATGPATLLTVTNSLAATPRATAALAAADGVPTGLTLLRWTAGARADDSVALADGMTVAQLAAAVTGAGNGWLGTASPGYESWPAADLRPPQGAYPAASGNAAGFTAHVNDLAFDADERLGKLLLGTDPGDPADSPRWGPAWSGETGGATSYGGTRGVRVVYQAGFADGVPADVQLSTAEAVKAALQRTDLNTNLQSASDGTLSITTRGELLHLPREVLAGLARWVNHRAG